jgi:hypothetical protein
LQRHLALVRLVLGKSVINSIGCQILWPNIDAKIGADDFCRPSLPAESGSRGRRSIQLPVPIFKPAYVRSLCGNAVTITIPSGISMNAEPANRKTISRVALSMAYT